MSSHCVGKYADGYMKTSRRNYMNQYFEEFYQYISAAVKKGHYDQENNFRNFCKEKGYENWDYEIFHKYFKEWLKSS